MATRKGAWSTSQLDEMQRMPMQETAFIGDVAKDGTSSPSKFVIVLDLRTLYPGVEGWLIRPIGGAQWPRK